MTPGLAGFVAAGETAGAGDDAVAAALAALGQGFTLLPDHGGRQQRRTFFDTFDWRLYRAGLLLEYVPGRGGGELRLTRPAGGEAAGGEAGSGGAAGDAVQPVTGWRAARPHLAGDLPPGPVADRIGNLVAPRALLPVTTVTTAARVTRLLNEDAKTVARLIVTRPVLAATGTPLTPRVSIAEVRGYAAQARRAARLLAAAPGITPANGTVLSDALAAAGRRLPDYTNKVNANVTASMPAARAAAAVLLRLLDMIEANVPGVLHDTDTEFLHDLRVAVRRTRSGLKMFGDVIDAAAASGGGTARFAAEFKWLGGITTPARDLDVHLLGFDETAGNLKAAKPDDLEPFRAFLRDRRAKEYRSLARGLRSPRFRELTKEWRAVLAPIREGRGPRGAAMVRSGKISAGELASERTRSVFAKVARRGGAITPDTPAEALHGLRKRCKELRYALEFFAPLYEPAAYGKVIADLKRLQDCLGVFQDSEVQITEIRALATAMLAANEAPAVTLLAMGEVTAALAAAQAAARAGFERRFADFAGIEGQRRMAAVLRGGIA